MMGPEKEQLNFHVHDVLAMFAAEDRAFTAVELQREIENKFGTSARFSSCSADGMDAKRSP